MVAHEAAKKYADKGILSFSCNPGNSIAVESTDTKFTASTGNLRTELQRYTTPLQMMFIVRRL